MNKTYRKMRERYMWPEIKAKITDFVRKCNICQKRKISRAKILEPIVITDTSLDIFDKVSLDTVGKFPTTPDDNRHILTMQDILPKYCIAVYVTPKKQYNALAEDEKNSSKQTKIATTAVRKQCITYS